MAGSSTRVGPVVAMGVAVVTLVMSGSVGARAQVGPFPGVPGSTTTAPGTTTTTKAPALLPPVDPAKQVSPSTTAPPRPSARPAPGAVALPASGGGDGILPPAGVGPFPGDLARMSRSVRRTGSRSTAALVAALKQLEDLGMPRDEVMRVGMGQFPVAGYATYSHDWWLPRFGPGWRLHLGTDIFAPRGTPVRAPANGVVKLSSSPLGGIAVYVIQPDATYYYLAHLDRRAPGLRDGQAVSQGDVVGTVGSSGNATGGSPHLHFEVHPAAKVVTKGKGRKATSVVVPLKVRPGTVLPAVDPKPFLDRYIADALANVPNLVAAYKASHPGAAQQAGAGGEAALTPGGNLDPNSPLASALVDAHRAGAAVPSPLVRTPLLALAFLFLLMVVALTPVLGTARGLPAHRPERRRRRSTPSAPPQVTEPAVT